MTASGARPHSAAMNKPRTIAELRASGYQPKTVKQELRDNVIARLKKGTGLFPGIVGYEESVLPQIENAILSGQDIVFLGERGQAKTRMARLLTELLDDEMPAIAGCEINDNPFAPICQACRQAVAERGDKAEIAWIPRATPVRREARHPRHHDRRPHRRGRPDQGRRGPLPRGRADHSLRARAADQPRDLRDQRAAGPRRAHPGRPAQHHGRARRADPRLQGAPADRRVRRGEREPRGLHQPRPDHHAAQGPLRLPDPHALSAAARGRDRDHGGRAHASSRLPGSSTRPRRT